MKVIDIFSQYEVISKNTLDFHKNTIIIVTLLLITTTRDQAKKLIEIYKHASHLTWEYKITWFVDSYLNNIKASISTPPTT